MKALINARNLPVFHAFPGSADEVNLAIKNLPILRPDLYCMRSLDVSLDASDVLIAVSAAISPFRAGGAAGSTASRSLSPRRRRTAIKMRLWKAWERAAARARDERSQRRGP
jgi:hypothetical protein